MTDYISSLAANRIQSDIVISCQYGVTVYKHKIHRFFPGGQIKWGLTSSYYTIPSECSKSTRQDRGSYYTIPGITLAIPGTLCPSF